VTLAAGEVAYYVGSNFYGPTNLCTAVQGYPLDASGHRLGTWGSSPFHEADGTRCARPLDWSSP
jgi:hypothetical protein